MAFAHFLPDPWRIVVTAGGTCATTCPSFVDGAGALEFCVGAVNPTSKPETESAVLNARIDWILSQNHWESVMRIENINSGCLDMPQSHHARQRQRLDILVVTNSFNTQASFSNQRHEMGSKHGLPLSQR